jgi:hypothetical protein
MRSIDASRQASAPPTAPAPTIAMKDIGVDYSTEMTTTSPVRDALAKKIALVTGGSRGIGFAIAEALTAHGATAVITGRTGRDLEEARLKLGGQTLAVEADVRNPEHVARAFQQTADRFGGLDVLVNNAGVGGFAHVADMSARDWQSVLETNLGGVFYCCHEAIPQGLESSLAPGLVESWRSLVTTSIFFSLSIHPSILPSVIRRRIRYQRPRSKLRYLVVSFSEASIRSKLEIPNSEPPHPPTIRLQ